MAFGALIHFPLAQPSNVGGVLGWSLVLILLVFGGVAGVMWLRKWLKEDDGPTAGSSIGFSISDLRQLHREGKMTAEEFERARVKMVAAGKAMADKLPDPLAGRRRPNQANPPPPTSPPTSPPPETGGKSG